jgi:hypothetical protein
MTEGERQRLLAHFEMTESWLVSEVRGLSDAQLRYRPTPDSWSVMDVVEHLAVAEAQYWQRLQDSMKQPAATTKPEATDAAILWYGIDRTNRARTGEARVPTGRWKDVQGDDRLRQDDDRRSAIAHAARREPGRVPVVPHDLHTLTAAHPADSRGQGDERVPDAVKNSERRIQNSERRGSQEVHSELRL